MSGGKAAAQAIHGALDTFRQSPPRIRESYLIDGHGPVVVLSAPDEAALRALYARALAEDLPCSLFIDENCRGVRSATVLGLGPLMRDDARLVTEELPLMK